jgi:hypothetical protein
VIIFVKIPQIIIGNNNLKKVFEIKLAYVTNDTVKTNIKNRIYHYTTSRETVTFDSYGMTGIDRSNIIFSRKLLGIFQIISITEVLHN